MKRPTTPWYDHSLSTPQLSGTQTIRNVSPKLNKSSEELLAGQLAILAKGKCNSDCPKPWLAHIGAARLCLFYKVVHGLVAVPLPDYIQYSNRVSRYCHSMTFRQVSTSTDYYIYSFFPLAIVQWNALPQSVACSQSLEVFKTAVCKLQHSRP